ncbi:MAG: hypothetical protein WD226_04595 [Planctomycetota bacterium]
MTEQGVPQTQATQPTPPKSNAWKWALGIGCGCLLIVLIGVGVIGGGLWWGIGKMLETEPVRRAVAEAEANPDVAAALGLPIEATWNMTGGGPPPMTQRDSGMTMEMNLELEGTLGSAPLTLRTREVDDAWVPEVMLVVLDGVTIDLLTDGYEVAE